MFPPNEPMGAKWCTAAQRPTGANCNPLDDDQPDEPPPGPYCWEAGAADSCIEPLIPPPPNLPEVCGSRNGQTLGCIPLPGPDCSITPAGSLCGGNPPPSPPDPPPPDVQPPPDTPPPPFICVHVGDECIEVDINISPPPGPPPPDSCPAGTHGTPPNCVQDQTCPDGSAPVGGMCPAPGSCPDGTTPQNGMCNAPSEPGEDEDGDGEIECNAGFAEVNGVCYQLCRDGSTPLNGQCAADNGGPDGEDGWCPNGARPVGGMCQVGSECNPATDPNQCEGPPDGNAGGGNTCEAAPYCSGDPIMCQVLSQQWQTRCAVQSLTEYDGDVPDGHEGESAGDTDVITEVGGDLLGQLSGTGWLGGGSCPMPPTFTMLGATYDFASMPWWCDALSVLAGVILFLGGFLAVRILVGG